MPIYFNGHDLTNRGGAVLTIGNELDYENYTISASGLQKVKDAYQNAIPVFLKQNNTLYAVVLLQEDGDNFNLAAVNSSGSYDNIEIDSVNNSIIVNGYGGDNEITITVSATGDAANNGYTVYVYVDELFSGDITNESNPKTITVSSESQHVIGLKGSRIYPNSVVKLDGTEQEGSIGCGTISVNIPDGGADHIIEISLSDRGAQCP